MISKPTPRPSATAGAAPVLRFRRSLQPPRVWSPLDAFFYNMMTTDVPIMLTLPLIAGAAFYFPVESLTAAILIAGAFCLVEAVVYAFLVSSMPRIGGDYVFQSRLLSGAVGTTFAFTGVVIGGALWMAIAGWFASKVAVGPFVVLLGYALENQTLIRIGDWVFSTSGVIAFGLLATAWGAVVNLRGMTVYARVQRSLVLVGFVALSVLVAYFALTRLSINQSGYRSFVYRSLEVGFRRQGYVTEWSAVVRLVPIVAFGLIYPGWVAFQAAEVRRAAELKVQFFTVVVSKLASIAFALVVLPLPIHHVGEELFGASVYLALNDPPSFWVLAPRLFGLNTAPWLSWIILASLAIAVNTWFWIWVPNHCLAASRVLLAMSWDHLLPRRFSRLDPIRGTPVFAVLCYSAFCALVVLLYSQLGVLSLALHGTLVSIAAFAVTCIAAALFPFLRRERYRESTAGPYEVARIPLITVAGATFAAFAAYLLWRYLAADGLFVGAEPLESVTTVVALFGMSLGLHTLFKRYRRSHEGADVDVYYREAEEG